MEFDSRPLLAMGEKRERTMQKRLLMPILPLLAVCCFTLNAAQDDEIQQLREMIRAQNAKIANLERAQAANQTTGKVDKAIAGKCYLSPDQPDIGGTGLSFTGEFLYWRADMTHIQYVSNQEGTASNGFYDETDGNCNEVKMGWSPGFRVGFGYKLPHDGWDIKGAYTYFRTDGEDTTTDYDEDELSPLFLNAGSADEDIELAEPKNEVALDIVDIDIGRRTQVSESISVRPFVGFRWASIDNSITTMYYEDFENRIDDDHYYVKMESEADLYGIRAGADLDMKIGHGFGAYGTGAVSLLTGEIDTLWHDHELEDGGLAVQTWYDHATMTRSVVVPVVQLAGGISYERKMADNINMKLSLGYEINHFIGGVSHFRNYDIEDGDNGGFFNDPRDISFHGLVFKVHLDF